jgi:hypothetical protein
MSGPHQYLEFMVFHIIWLLWMITPISARHSPSDASLTSTRLLSTSLLMFALSLVYPLSASRLITARNSSTLPRPPSWRHLLCLSCPYTSAQNGKAELVLRTLNNSMHTLLLHASMPASYWAEALATACYLLNRRPSSAIHSEIPFTHLYRKSPSYDHLRIFGYLCYPNLQATSAHKLAPRSTACVFLGYPSAHKGYRCLDLATGRVYISRHVIFDETHFPFADTLPPSPAPSLDFFDR